MACIKNILGKINNINTTISNKNIKRLGTGKDGKIRPVLVKMISHEDVTNVLIHWRLISPQYHVAADLTPCQRKYLQKVKVNANEFNLNEDNKKKNLKQKVKFINGNPTLVTIKNKKSVLDIDPNSSANNVAHEVKN